MVPNLSGGVFASKFEVLRNGGNDRSIKDLNVIPNSRSGVDDSMGMNMTIISNDNVVMDDSKRLNGYVFPDTGVRVNR